MPRVVPPLEVNRTHQPPTAPNQHADSQHQGRQPSNAVSPSLVESVAGFSAGVVSTLVVHPFDIIKTRLQIRQTSPLGAHGTTPSSWIVMRQIVREAAFESPLAGGGRASVTAVLRSYYRGLMPNMIGNSVSWALYFMWYGKIKDLVRAARGAAHGSPLTSVDYFLASGASGVLTAVLTNPIWVIKTRMLSSPAHAPGAYRSIAHGTSEIFRREGVRGFYRGLLPSLFGVSHGAIQFMAYEQLKNQWAKKRPGGKEGLTNADVLFLSAGSKMFAGSITYPYQVVRARLQTYDAKERYKNVTDCVRTIWRHEGLRAFYSGCVPPFRSDLCTGLFSLMVECLN